MLEALIVASLAAASSAPVVVTAEMTEKETSCVCSHGPGAAPPAPGGAVFIPEGARGQQAMVWVHSEERREELGNSKDPHAPKNVFIFRTQSSVGGDADSNGDGRITRKEFLRKAEAGFKRLDKDGNGVLELAEMAPPPPLPPIPPMPHVAPVPPAPPAPPGAPSWTVPVPPPAVAPVAPPAPPAPRAPTMSPVPDPQ